MKKTTIPLIILLMVTLFGGLMLVKQNQDTRKGASFANTKLMLLPNSRIDKVVGELVPVKVHFLTESGAKVDGVKTEVCWGSHLKLDEGKIVVNTQNGFDSNPIIVFKDNCVTLVATSKLAADKLKTTGEVFALNFEAISEGEGPIYIKKESSMVTGDNSASAIDKEIAVTSVENTTYKIADATDRPDYCVSASVDKTELEAGQSVLISSESNTDVNNFFYIVYNKGNTNPDNTPKPVCVGGSGYQGACPANSHVLTFSDPSKTLRKTGSVTVTYAQLFDVADVNNGGNKPTNVQINAYFSKTGGQTSVPKTACVRAVKTEVQNCNRCSTVFKYMRVSWNATDCSKDPISTSSSADIEVIRTYDASCTIGNDPLQCSRCSKVNDKEYVWWLREANKTCNDDPVASQSVYRAFREECSLSTGEWPVLNYKVQYAFVKPDYSKCFVPNDWPLQIIVLSGGITKTYNDVVPSKINRSGNFVTAEGSLILEGFDKTTNVAVFMKGPKHLQMKYAVDKQGGRYNKAGGELTLTKFVETSPVYDFTAYPILPGDIVGKNSNNPDGVVNGYDWTEVKKWAKVFETTEDGGYFKADLDGSCQVNSNDLYILRLTLEEKQGELY